MNLRQKMIAFSILLFAAAVVVGGLGWYQSAFADTSSTPGSTPGSVDDPIVTKGYVDDTVTKLVQQELEKLGSIGGGASKLEVVTVPFGSKVIVEDGGELVVRSGKAVAYSPDANGLSDMTDGVDIPPGKTLGNNHLILFPRGGRGVQADPKQTKGLIVLIRGAYQLQ
jgi:hypothetical protein